MYKIYAHLVNTCNHYSKLKASPSELNEHMFLMVETLSQSDHHQRRTSTKGTRRRKITISKTSSVSWNSSLLACAHTWEGYDEAGQWLQAAQLTVSQFTSASISSVISIALTAIHVLDCTLAVHTRTISTLGPCCHRVFFTIQFHSNGGHQPKAPKRHEYATYLLQYFQCSKWHTSTQDTVYQSTVIPLEVCCSPTVMLIHSVSYTWCQTVWTSHLR